MNKLFRHILSLITVATATVLASCNSIVHDDLTDCPEGMVIELTPKYAARSSFEAEMSDVHIFIYDKNDELVSELNFSGEELAAQDYCVTTHIPVGDYRLVVWNGISDTNNYSVANAAVTLKTDSNNSTDNILSPLWHGAVDDIAIESLEMKHVTVPMVKDTNNFIVFLCTTNGETLNPNDFDFKITCKNGLLAQDNSLLTSPTITYNDFVCREDQIEGSIAPDLAPADELGNLHLVRGELNTLRLTTPRATYLSITQKDSSRNIITINLIDYILKAFRSDASSALIADQVYLDTEDLFNITFFLTPKAGKDVDEPSTIYVCASLKINQWILRLQDVEFVR